MAIQAILNPLPFTDIKSTSLTGESEFVGIFWFRYNVSVSSGEDESPSNKCIEEQVLENNITFLPEWAEAILIAGNILVLLFAFCGNIAALVVVFRSRMSRKSMKIFLVSLALSDLIVAISTTPIEIGYVIETFHTWIFGAILCKVIPFVQISSVMTNAFCLLAIAIDRYFSVVQSFKNPTLAAKWKNYLPYIGCGLIWLLPLSCGLPNLWAYEHVSISSLLSKGNDTSPPRNQTCKSYYLCRKKKEFDQANLIYYITIGIIFHVLVIGFVFCYISILSFVKSHDKFHSSRNNNSNNNNNSEESRRNVAAGHHRRTFRLIMILIGIYTLCRCPAWIWLIVINTKKIDVTIPILCIYYFLHLLSNANAAINPFVYAIWNDALRSGNEQRSTTARHHRVHSTGTLARNSKSPLQSNPECLANDSNSRCNHASSSTPHFACFSCCIIPCTSTCPTLNSYDVKESNGISMQSTQRYFCSSRQELPPINITNT